MIIFKKVRWKNFLSTGNHFTEVWLDKERSVLVVGSNGSGKSTMLDALTYVLYGKPFRNINKPQLVNSINQKGLLVEVEFSIGRNNYLVRRGIKPNCFEIFRNDELIDQSSKVFDYQDILTKQILKLTYKSFCQVVILGNASFVPFMQLSAMDRRAIIEDILDIQIFSVMNTLLKEKTQTNKDAIADCKQRMLLTTEKYNMYKQHIEERKNDVAVRARDLENKSQQASASMQNALKTIEQLNNQIADINNKMADKVKVKENINKLHKFDVKLSTNLETTVKSITFFEHNDSCPTCTQDIDAQFKQHVLQEKRKKKQSIESSIEELQAHQQKAEARLAEIEQLTNQLYDITMQVSIERQNISHYEKIIAEINRDLQKIAVENNPNISEDDVASYKTSLANLRREATKLSNSRDVIGAAAVLLKDGGVKAQIIKQYIPLINQMINQYLSAMQFFVQFELDENFRETIKSRHRDAFSYDSFSEGEKMRINLAVLFTWRSIAKMRNTASTNLLIMDEVFDSSLDTTGTDEFMKILNELTEGTNTFVISHKGDQLIEKFDRVIQFSKKQNFSTMNIME